MKIQNNFSPYLLCWSYENETQVKNLIFYILHPIMKLSIYQFIGFRYKSLQNKAPLVKFHFLCSFSAFFASTSIEQVLQVMETLIHDWDIIIK